MYLVVPAERLDGYAGRMRLVVASTLTSLMRVRGGAERPFLLLLDEVEQQGHMEPVPRAVSLGRGYGVQLWLLIQSLSQVEPIYGRDGRGFMANAELVRAFGVADPDKADYFSRRRAQYESRARTSPET